MERENVFNRVLEELDLHFKQKQKFDFPSYVVYKTHEPKGKSKLYCF
jgi:hypothetical protein